MMRQRKVQQDSLFCDFSLERHVPLKTPVAIVRSALIRVLNVG